MPKKIKLGITKMGTIDISGNICIADPCLDKSDPSVIKLEKAKHGKWNVYIRFFEINTVNSVYIFHNSIKEVL